MFCSPSLLLRDSVLGFKTRRKININHAITLLRKQFPLWSVIILIAKLMVLLPSVRPLIPEVWWDKLSVDCVAVIFDWKIVSLQKERKRVVWKSKHQGPGLSATEVGRDADPHQLKIFFTTVPILKRLEKCSANYIGVWVFSNWHQPCSRKQGILFYLNLAELMNQLFGFSEPYLQSSYSFGPC